MVSKTSRQLAIFHIFLYSRVVEFIEITNLIEIKNKTIMRDIKDLQNAGLINVRFSKKENGYIHINDNCRCPFSAPVFSENKAKNMHLEKLIRLGSIMVGLNGHTELPYWDDNYSENQKTCMSWYQSNFPNVSRRTMQRDFQELDKIGYSITYDRYDRYYRVDFPWSIEGLDLKGE